MLRGLFRAPLTGSQSLSPVGPWKPRLFPARPVGSDWLSAREIPSPSLSSRGIWLTRNTDQTRERIQGVYVQCHSTISAYKLDIATMIVYSRRRVRALNYGRMGAGHSSSWSSPLEDVTTSITILPSADTKVQEIFKLTTRRSDETHGVFVSIPVLCVNNVLPDGSPVFSIVKEGRLDDFMALLRDGEASIRDHDEYGASLLHVSVTCSHHPMSYRDSC